MKTTNPIVRNRDKGFYARLRKGLYRKAFEHADRVLTLSDAETALLKDQFPSAAGNIATVINPYVTTAMLAPAAVMTMEDTRKHILGVGRFEPQKRMDLLIRAFAALGDPETRLVILGDGPDRAACEQLAKDLKIEDRLHTPGFVTDVASWLRTADVFVLTSVYEGLPAVILEAMACNCPILSTDCFLAARELLEKAEGCALIEDETPSAVADLMRERLDLPRPQNLKETARKYSVENGVSSHIAHVRALFD